VFWRGYRDFDGGIEVPDRKQSTRNSAVRPCGPLKRLRVPLCVCGADPGRILVRPGQYVQAGSPLTDPPAEMAEVPVFAPLDGRVARVHDRESPYLVRISTSQGPRQVPALELTELGEPQQPPEPSWAGQRDGEHDAEDSAPLRAWREAEPREIREYLAAGGLVNCQCGPEPLSSWLERAREKSVRRLVVNAMESQPYVTADHRMLVDYGGQVLVGAAILARAMGSRFHGHRPARRKRRRLELLLAVDRRLSREYEPLEPHIGALAVTVFALPHKYPIDHPHILTRVLTGREVPLGGEPMDLRTAVTDPATCLAVARWVMRGQHPTHRVCTVAGERVERPGNLWTPCGAGCEELTAPHAASAGPVIHGSPMDGWPCGPDAVVAPATDGVLAIEASPMPVPGPCVRCSWCSDHCPARLQVIGLNDAFELADLDLAERLLPEACLECGTCTYVCPARLPLARRVTRLKRALREPALSPEDAPAEQPPALRRKGEAK
jgi:electron transport complex protein RnfC